MSDLRLEFTLKNRGIEKAIRCACCDDDVKTLERLLSQPGIPLTESINRRRRDRTALDWAACYGSEAVTTFLLRHGAQPDLQDKITIWNDDAPLHRASEHNHSGLVNILLDNGAFIDIQGDEFWTPLHYAANAGAIDAVNILLKRGTDPELWSQHGAAPFHLACLANQEPVVRMFLEHGMDVNNADRDGSTPLHWAASEGALDAAKTLLEFHAELQLRDLDGDTPFHYAYCHPQVLQLFLEHGIDVNIRGAQNMTALHYVAKYGTADAVLFLIKHGADLKSKDSDGNTPLHRASVSDNFEAMKVLIEHGADLEPTNQNDCTPFYKAVCFGSFRAVEYLLSRGAVPHVNTPEYPEETMNSLSFACGSDKPQILRTLLQMHEDVNQFFEYGKTLLQVAVTCNALECVKTLLAHNADPSRPGKFGQTAIHIACCEAIDTPMEKIYKRGPIVRLLLEAGVEVNTLNRAGETPLLAAARAQRPDKNSREEEAQWDQDEAVLVNTLLEFHADSTTRNQLGYTALEVAAMTNKPAIVNILYAEYCRLRNAGQWPEPLHDSVEPSVPIGLPTSQLDRLPTSELTQSQLENEEHCTICLEHWVLGERVTVLECGHIFHAQCILEWLTNNSKCPFCKRTVELSNV